MTGQETPHLFLNQSEVKLNLIVTKQGSTSSHLSQ